MAAVCPACGRGRQAIAAGLSPRPALTGGIVLGVAIVAAALSVRQMTAMGMGIDMGLGPPAAFAGTWALMMTAMMLPSALPFFAGFARDFGRRRGWQPATLLLGAAYLAVWLGFGVAAYALYTLLRMPWPEQRLAGGLLLVLAAVYALTPLKRAAQARCHELCALHGPLPFSLTRSAALAGVKYGLTCVACTAGLMLAMLVVGMASLLWAAIIAVLVLIYKLAPPPTLRWELLLSAVIAGLGVTYVLTG